MLKVIHPHYYKTTYQKTDIMKSTRNDISNLSYRQCGCVRILERSIARAIGNAITNVFARLTFSKNDRLNTTERLTSTSYADLTHIQTRTF